jgi:hypothetical protein
MISKASGELADRLELAEVADGHLHVAITGPLGILVRASSPRSRLRATSQTAAPKRTKPSAVAKPSPELAPVTIATLTSRLSRSTAGHVRLRIR